VALPRIRPLRTSARRIREFWDQDRGLSVFLLLLVVVVFILAPASNPLPGRRNLFIVFISALFGFGGFAVARTRVIGVTVLVLAAAPVLLHTAGRPGADDRWEAASALAACAFAVTLALLVAGRVLRGGAVTVHHIIGAVAIYLLIGVAFGEATRAMGLLDPEAYKSASGRTVERAELYYFSFVTLTTVGYGDITPAARLTQSLATLEALVGQLYPVVILARLVSLDVEDRKRGL